MRNVIYNSYYINGNKIHNTTYALLRLPLRGDSPQCGEMSRSDREARPRERSRAAGEGWPQRHETYPSHPSPPIGGAFPLWHFVPPPPYRGSLSSKGSLYYIAIILTFLISHFSFSLPWGKMRNEKRNVW